MGRRLRTSGLALAVLGALAWTAPAAAEQPVEGYRLVKATDVERGTVMLGDELFLVTETTELRNREGQPIRLGSLRAYPRGALVVDTRQVDAVHFKGRRLDDGRRVLDRLKIVDRLPE